MMKNGRERKKMDDSMAWTIRDSEMMREAYMEMYLI